MILNIRENVIKDKLSEKIMRTKKATRSIPVSIRKILF